MNNQPDEEIKILMLEDNPADAELNARELHKGKLNFSYIQVQNEVEFSRALREYGASIILADYSLPMFDGLSALAIAVKMCPGIPFIFVSGTIGEELAVETLKRGASDYIIKDRLYRLPSAVRHALDGAMEKARLQKAEDQLNEYHFHLEKLVRERTEALAESEERFRTLAEAMPQIVWTADADGKMNYFNQRAYDYGGFRPGNITEWDWSAIIHKEDIKSTAAEWDHSIKTGEIYMVEQRILRANGEYRWHLTRAIPVRDEVGRILRWVGTSTDIHEQKLSEKKYITILETTQNGFSLFDGDGRFLEVNQAYSEMSGYTRDELLRMYISDLEASESPQEVIEHIKKARQAGHHQFESKLRRKDGSVFDVDVSTTYQDIQDGQFVAFVRDITERRKIDQIKDEFIGMVSHEIKTPLTVIVGALSTAMTDGLPKELTMDLLHDALNYTEILDAIVENLLELSRSQSNRLILRKEPVDIKQIAEKTAAQLQKRSVKHVLNVNMPQSLPPVFVDRFRLERVLNNLIDNAVKYSPSGGEVKIFTRLEPRRLVVGVSDTGIGITGEEQTKLFQKFQRLATINSSIQGIGLGLNVCRILVEAHGGEIWVESEPGKGSTFYFSIPLNK